MLPFLFGNPLEQHCDVGTIYPLINSVHSRKNANRRLYNGITKVKLATSDRIKSRRQPRLRDLF